MYGKEKTQLACCEGEWTYYLAIKNSSKVIQDLCNTRLKQKMSCKENWNCPIFTSQQLAKWLFSLGLCISSQPQWSSTSAERCVSLFYRALFQMWGKKAIVCTHSFIGTTHLHWKAGEIPSVAKRRILKKHSFVFMCVTDLGNLRR